MAIKDDDSAKGGKKPWRKPRIQGLQTDGPPICNPAFPQAQVCATNGLVQSSIGCNVKGIFS